MKLLVETTSDEYNAPCCFISREAIQAIADDRFAIDDVVTFIEEVQAYGYEGMEPEPCLVVHFEGRWPELYTERSLRLSLVQLVGKVALNQE